MRPTEPSITVPAYAKINWTLDVLAPRDDGYHTIASVMQRVKLADWVTVTASGTGITVRVVGPESLGVPVDDNNIVVSAAKALGVENVTVTLEKNIPNQAGLGGGSSNCAAALSALNVLFKLGHSPNQMNEIATYLGSDVPFFFCPGTARVEGIGEKVTQINSPGPIDIVILKPDEGVSTKVAYNAIDLAVGRFSNNGTVRWPNGGPSNDFEDVIYSLYPAVNEARLALKEAGATETLLCGSGAAVMGWGNDMRQVASNLRRAGHQNIWLTQTV
jgi:4-diphosphocytidyl-2-C-methyl-D-erythritol kinase